MITTIIGFIAFLACIWFSGYAFGRWHTLRRVRKDILAHYGSLSPLDKLPKE